MWREFLVIVTFVTNILCLSLGNPFLLQNAPAALTDLATSASASASAFAPSQPITHIADLRKKQHKAGQLQSEKLLVLDDADTDLSVEGVNENDNEAAPTLWQKKIGKILRKIRFFSSLAGRPGGNGGGGEVNVTATNGHSGNTTIVITAENDTSAKSPDDVDNDIKTSEEITTRRLPTFQKIIYPHSKYDTPLKVGFDVSEKIVNEPDAEDIDEEIQNIQTVEDMNRFGQIGVFFAELLGSIVGLVYGAAAHITSGTNGAARNLE